MHSLLGKPAVAHLETESLILDILPLEAKGEAAIEGRFPP